MNEDPLNPYPGNLRTHKVVPLVKVGFPKDYLNMPKLQDAWALSKLLRISGDEAMAMINKSKKSMSTTNDPQGEYKRKPMLDSDELYDEYLGDCPGNVGGTVIEKVINFYEGKINDGTLMVVRTARSTDGCCDSCDRWTGDGPNYCPGCGAKIIE